LDIDSVALMLDKIRAITSLPVTVGFGIKDADTAQSVSRLAEGVVVGSALVNRVVELASEDQSQRIIQSAQLIGGIRQAIDTA
jgi:tryptophan synthase alpha chain